MIQRGDLISLSSCRQSTCRSSMLHRRKKPLMTAAELHPTNSNACKAEQAESKPSISKNTVIKDNWFDRMAINHLSTSIESITGVKRKELGYEGFVEAASVIARRNGRDEQQDMVVDVLRKAFPAAVMATLKTLLPQTKFSREFFAVFTTIFFSWLVGPCEVKESDFEGKKEKNVVYIPKCRFLEATNCVGMCTNICKLPSQKFIYSSLGMPTSLVPNFEDKSCEIIFGQLPPTNDPALKQPCFQTSCIVKQTLFVDCSS